MKISIITVVRNNVKTIKQAIDSVLNQSYSDIEYIIIDGLSTDGTIEIIKSYGSKITKFVSEKDSGIYDAMNKGISLATGDVIGILNSDDFYKTNEVISLVMKEMNNESLDCCYGDLEMIDQNSKKVIRYWQSSNFSKGMFLYGWQPPHPSFFLKKSIYERFGYFDLEFRISADDELMLRVLEKNNINSKYISEVLTVMRLGGESNRNIKNVVKGNYESYKALRKNGFKISFIVYIIRRIKYKLPQLFKKGSK